MIDWEVEAARHLRRAERYSRATWAAILITGGLTLLGAGLGTDALLWSAVPAMVSILVFAVLATSAEGDYHDATLMAAL